ncbi:MAG: K(+)-transporting ATPase subunit F [Acidobacteriaceae bacterium]
MGHRNDCSGNWVLCNRDPIYRGLQPVGEQGEQPMIEAVVLLTIVVLLFGYLVFALLRPEKF